MQNIHLLGSGSGSGLGSGSVPGGGGGVGASGAGGNVSIKSGNFLTASNVQHTAQVESWRRDYLKVIDRHKDMEQLHPNRLKKSANQGDSDDDDEYDAENGSGGVGGSGNRCRRRHYQYHGADDDDGIQEIQIEIPMEYVNKWHRNNSVLNKQKTLKDSRNPLSRNVGSVGGGVGGGGGNGGGGSQTMV